MRICDLTLAYSETSGGIRTYIDQKRRYLLEHTGHEHVLIVPGERDEIERGDRWETHLIKSPGSGHGSYRVLWRPDKIRRALRLAQPDIIELGTYFVCPWPALRYRDRQRRSKKRCAVVGYFHTDLADAYFRSPVNDKLHDWFEGWSNTLVDLGEGLADLLQEGAEAYFGSIFQRCDALLAASQEQARRLRDYGAKEASIIPMGVDTRRFTPDRRSQAVRDRYQATADTCLMTYAGRLDEEKHLDTVIDAFQLARRRGLQGRLVIAGDGPLRSHLEQRAREIDHLVIPGYIGEVDQLADLLASSDLYVTAGPHETFGLSVVEAQASGLPVVGVASGALIERVIEGTGYLGPVRDARAMARLMQKAFMERDRLSLSAREHVVQNFSWEDSFHKLIDLYQTLLTSDGQMITDDELAS